MSAIEKQFEEWLKKQCTKKKDAALKDNTIARYVGELKLERKKEGGLLYQKIRDIIAEKFGAKSFYEINTFGDYTKVSSNVKIALKEIEEEFRKELTKQGEIRKPGALILRNALVRYGEFLKKQKN